MIYVELVKGKIRISKDAKKARIFRHTDIDKMAKFLGPASLTDHWMTSSSVNHPYEEGFSKSFDIDPVLAAVRQQVLDDGAARVEPGPPIGAAKRIEQLLEGSQFPRSIKFLRTDDEPGPSGNGDVSLTFSSADELCTFLNGVRYAERLLKVRYAERLLKLESRLQKGVVKVKRARR